MARVTKRGSFPERMRRTTERIRKQEIQDLPGGGAATGSVFCRATHSGTVVTLPTHGRSFLFPLDTITEQSGGFGLTDPSWFATTPGDHALTAPADGLYAVQFNAQLQSIDLDLVASFIQLSAFIEGYAQYAQSIGWVVNVHDNDADGYASFPGGGDPIFVAVAAVTQLAAGDPVYVDGQVHAGEATSGFSAAVGLSDISAYGTHENGYGLAVWKIG